MNSRMRKSKKTGNLYEVQYVVHRSADAPADAPDVFACYRLSAYDGMPIGSLVWIAEDEFEETERVRDRA